MEVFRQSPSDALQFTLMTTFLCKDYIEVVYRIGKTTAVMRSKATIKLAERLVELVQMDQSEKF